MLKILILTAGNTNQALGFSDLYNILGRKNTFIPLSGTSPVNV